MACALTQDYTIGCRDSIGGIRTLYLIEIANVSGITSSAGVATAISKANNRRFYQYDLVKNTSEAMETFTDSRENGTTFYAQEIDFVLNKLQATSRNEIILLAQNRLMAVVEDRNGAFWLYGQVNGLMREGGKAGTGKAMGDRNGYELKFTGEETAMALSVSSGIIAGLIIA